MIGLSHYLEHMQFKSITRPTVLYWGARRRAEASTRSSRAVRARTSRARERLSPAARARENNESTGSCSGSLRSGSFTRLPCLPRE